MGTGRSGGLEDDVIVSALGPCTVIGVPGPPLSSIQRRILSRLALVAPDPVAVAHLEEAVWGDDPPATARTALQNQVSRLRGRLGADAIITSGHGYALVLATDLALVADGLSEAEAATRREEPAHAYAVADEALERWRGRPLDDLGEHPAAQGARIHLREVARGLEDVRLGAAIALGRKRWAVAEAERLVGVDLRDEHRWALLVLALAGAGRRGAALAAVERAQRALADDLGLGLGPELRAAQADVLALDDLTDPAVARRTVGRRREIEAIFASLEHCSVTLVRGDAGAGKTTILAEAGRQLRRRGWRTTSAACGAHPASPVALLVDLVDGLDIAADHRLAPVARFVDAITRDISAHGALVLSVDDLDRAGPTSLAALVGVSSLDGVSLLATGTEDVELGPNIDVGRVRLGPLGDDEMRELVADTLGRGAAMSPESDAWLAAMSGGSPLLLVALLDDPEVRAGLARPRVGPPTVEASGLHEVVSRRLNRLGPSARHALLAAAVCGPVFPRALLSALADRIGIDEAVADGLLVADPDPSGQLRFRHGAVQQVLFDEVPPGHRIELHHRAAAVLVEIGGTPTAIAGHAVAAAEVDPADAHRWALRAAGAASAVGAHAEAAEWCERALAIAGSTLGERPRVRALIRRGDALRLAGSGEQEVALFEAADAAVASGHADLIGHAAFAALQLGATTESGSMHERAVVLAEHALSVVTDPDAWAGIAAAASLMYSMTGRHERCRELFVAAEERAASSAARRHVLPFAFLALGHPGDLDRREAITDELLVLAAEADDPVAGFEAHQLALSVAVQRGDGPRVRASIVELDALLLRVGDVGRRWALAYLRAAVAHLDGDLARSEDLAELALTTFADVSPSRAFATYSGQLLPLRLATGRLGELTPQLTALVADQPVVPAWHAALALCLAPDDAETASVHAAAALGDVPLDFTWLAAHLIGGRAAAQIGDLALVGRYVERLQPWSGLVCWVGTCAYGPVDTVLALLARTVGDTERASELAASARATATRLEAAVFVDEVDRLFG